MDVNLSLLDYGGNGTYETTPERSMRITNTGNVPIDLGAYGYGSVVDDSLSFTCQYNGIPIGYERFSLSSGVGWDSMTSVSGSSVAPSAIPANIDKTLTNLSNQSREVFWRLQIPVGVFGLCNGSLVLSAEENS